MNRVDGKVALVSGAAQGIGRRVAELLAECGAKVMLTDIDEAGGAEVVKAIEAAGGTAHFTKHDVTSEEQWAAVVDGCVAELGGLDILVNNAGIFFYAPIEAMTLEQWHRIRKG